MISLILLRIMADPAEDSEDATSSLGDEERVRRLFQACDGDGDGFIDRFVLLLYKNAFSSYLRLLK